MNELFPYDDTTPPDHTEEPLSRHDARESAQIAQELLSRSGWTGAQIETLERVAAMSDDDPDTLENVREMKDARDREDALK